ncbi:MAG: hypothetical protein J0M20_09510, partial [Burkholderiales bacterium]|nr:hypothetical protein [Burkholderiales bacterium]
AADAVLGENNPHRCAVLRGLVGRLAGSPGRLVQLVSFLLATSATCATEETLEMLGLGYFGADMEGVVARLGRQETKDLVKVLAYYRRDPACEVLSQAERSPRSAAMTAGSPPRRCPMAAMSTPPSGPAAR